MLEGVSLPSCAISLCKCATINGGGDAAYIDLRWFVQLMERLSPKYMINILPCWPSTNSTYVCIAMCDSKLLLVFDVLYEMGVVLARPKQTESTFVHCFLPKLYSCPHARFRCANALPSMTMVTLPTSILRYNNFNTGSALVFVD